MKPSRTISNGPVSGTKQSKDHVTILLIYKATGSEKLCPLFIHKYKNPWALKNIDKKTSVIAILLMFSYKPTPKDLQIAQVNFYDALSSDDIERLIFIIKIFNRQDFCKIIIKFLIYYLMIKYTPYLPSLLY